MICSFIGYGPEGVLNWAAGCIVPILLLAILFIFRVIGGADVKAFSVIGGFVFYKGAINIIIISFIIGAVFSLAKMIIHRNLFIRLSYFLSYFKNLFQYGKVKKYCEDDFSKDMVIHFMIPIFISTIIYFR